MSRVAKAPIIIPSGVAVILEDREMTVKGIKGELSFVFHDAVTVVVVNDLITMRWNENDKFAASQAGTTRAVISNMIVGVTVGFEKKLILVGVGYKVQERGNVLTLSLGFSHSVEFEIPLGVSVETPTQTEIVVKGSNKQLVGEVAAKIRSYRSPEPYKGKGVRYSGENIIRKESKKK